MLLVQHLGRVAGTAAGEREDQVEHLERLDDSHDHEEERRVADAGEGDVAESLQGRRAVAGGGIVQLA